MLYGHPRRRMSISEEVDWIGEQALQAAPKKRGAPERRIMRAVRAFVPMAVRGAVCVHVPNEIVAPSRGELRHRAADGVLAGFPDLIVLLPPGRMRLWEIKAPKGRLSDAQKDLFPRLEALGHPVALIRSIDDAEADLRAMGLEVSATAKALASRGGRVGALGPVPG